MKTSCRVCGAPALAESLCFRHRGRTCAICGEPTEPHRVDGTCGRVECKFALERRQRQDRRIAKRQELLAEAERIHAEHAPTVDGRKIPLAVIPSAQEPRERPSPERIAQHRAFLLELARQSHDPATPTEDRPETIVWTGELPESMNSRIVQLCTICEGHCCHLGGNHAFLTASTLRRVRLHQADVTDEDLVAQYLGYIPEEIVEYSCIYHAPTGCALPREMRSDTSRNYFCPSLVDAMKLMASGEEQLFAVAISESAVERTGIVR